MEKKYTYVDFALEVISIVEDMKLDQKLETVIADRIIDKANALYQAQVKKADYSKTHPKKSTSKGASEKTLALVEKISTVLNSTPKTGAEISQELGIELNPLQISNAVKYIQGVKSEKVVRVSTNAKGLKSEKLYTAYSIQ